MALSPAEVQERWEASAASRVAELEKRIDDQLTIGSRCYVLNDDDAPLFQMLKEKYEYVGWVVTHRIGDYGRFYMYFAVKK